MSIAVKPSLILIMLFLLTGCIELYYPDREDLQVGNLVVSADLHSIPGKQDIRLSRSIPLNKTLFEPEQGCYVVVRRGDGETRVFTETDPGIYEKEIDAGFFRTGFSFRLEVITSRGQQYESSFETLRPSPPVTEVYFEREDHPTGDPDMIDEGIQFYLDFEIDKEQSRYLRWELIETYEIHQPDYQTRVYGADRRMRDLYSSDKKLVCWITRDITEIFTLDLLNVEGSVYRRYPLHFVTSETQRLHHRYSLLVRQLSLSEEAFWYWNELAKNVQSMGGLFDTQPSLTPGNICNMDDGGERVIGYFSVSGAVEKRIFVEAVPGLRLSLDPEYCAPTYMPMFLSSFPADQLPIYIATANLFGKQRTGVVRDECVDCTLMKGSSWIKPEFW